MAEKLNPFYSLLKTEVPINIKSEAKETIDDDHKAKTTQSLSNLGTRSTGDNTEFVNSSRNLRASRWISL